MNFFGRIPIYIYNFLQIIQYMRSPVGCSAAFMRSIQWGRCIVHAGQVIHVRSKANDIMCSGTTHRREEVNDLAANHLFLLGKYVLKFRDFFVRICDRRYIILAFVQNLMTLIKAHLADEWLSQWHSALVHFCSVHWYTKWNGFEY